MAVLRFAACDLGAESGRCMLGSFDGGRVALHEARRFPNEPVRVTSGLHWDALRLFGEILLGLRAAASEQGRLDGIGVDAWGVDFALLDSRDALIGNPYHYRDRRTEGVLPEALRLARREEIYAQTGIQLMPINTLYQLFIMVRERDPALAHAQTLLMMPDLFNFWLSGEKACEATEATTSQCYDPKVGAWATELLERFGIPPRIFPRVIGPAAVLAPLRTEVAEGIEAGGAPVIAGACHDTAAAVAAIPAQEPGFAYISSGTWSLVGTEVAEPILSPAAMQANLTNEGGVAATLLHRNVMGLWLLQQSRRQWERDGAVTYDELLEAARRSQPFGPIIDPDDEQFLRPTDVPGSIRGVCKRSGQPVPDDHGAVVRCILESLAVKYRWVIDRLEEVTGRRIPVVHIIGGGSRNTLLCQLAADAMGRVVRAGPAEATAMGNVLVQAMALGHIGSLDELRSVVRASTPVVDYTPHPDPRWDAALDQLKELMAYAAGMG
jgi:rhamnulokinase